MRMDGMGPHAASMIRISLSEGEAIHVLKQRLIAAFQGKSGQREDRLLKLGEMYRKRSFVESVLHGESDVWLGIPAGFFFQEVPISLKNELLFDTRNVLYYTPGIRMHNKLQTVKRALFTQDLMRVRFTGEGSVGLLGCGGPLRSIQLRTDKPLYADMRCLVAYPESARMRLSVYGNPLASQSMPYQWEIYGEGVVLLQPGLPDEALRRTMESDSLLRRILREVVPFGGIWFR